MEFQVMLPCELGKEVTVEGHSLTLTGVNWFYWSSRGYEYTYSFSRNERVEKLLTNTDKRCPKCKPIYQIDESLLKDGPLKEKGYPFKGTGYLFGLNFENGKFYAELILSSKYLIHVQCECDTTGRWNGGGILFPPTPSFDDDEKKNAILLKSMLKGGNKNDGSN